MKEFKFDLLIIDEACQCTELTSLIPFSYNINQSILIGDPKQLPPTIKSHKIEKYDYGKSLFERIQEGSPSSEVFLLDTQYRMHPSISKLSSKCFYEGKIIDGPNVKSSEWIKEWTKSKDSKFGPVLFYNVEGYVDNNRGSSFYNEVEANQVINFISELLQTYPDICFHKKISIISPYSAQVYYIKRKLKELYKRSLKNLWEYMGFTNEKTLKFYNDDIEIESDERYKNLLLEENIFDHINISTVDSFQGQENDIIIISTVRSDGKIGFLKDKRRLNVSISRSRYSLIIFGDSSTLIKNRDWNNIVTEIKNMNCFKNVNIYYKTYVSIYHKKLIFMSFKCIYIYLFIYIFKILKDTVFNDLECFPFNLLPKEFFESLKKQIEREKQIGKFYIINID